MNKKRIVIIIMLGLVLICLFIIKKEVTNFSQPIQVKESVNVEEYGVVGDGITDDSVKFQLAINDAVRKNKVLIVPAKTYLVSPLRYRDSSSLDWWCLSIPSNAKIYFETGAKLKLVDNAPAKTRVFVIYEATNVNIYGRLEVDGSAHTVLNGNEHMHGIFIYDSKDIFIESAYSYNSYGDNLFIGGTEEDHSENVQINEFRGVTAGRKNLVLHYVDNLHIGTAILDNSKGDVLNNWLGGNSLDLEPDDYEGKKKFYQRIDYISTYGMGNDFTVGTKRAIAKKWILEIGNFHVVLMKGAVEGLQSYASTVKIDKLFIKSFPGNKDQGINLSYGAHWEIKEAYFVDGGDFAISAKAIDEDKPMLMLEKVFISRPSGKGLKLWGTDAEIKSLEMNSVRESGLDILSTSHQQVNIENFIIRNSGESEIISVSDYGYKPKVSIGNLLVMDDRKDHANSIVYLETQVAVDHFKIKNLQNFDLINEVTYGSSVIEKGID